MNKHVALQRVGERPHGKGPFRESALWHRLLMVCVTMTFLLWSSPPGEALNGEPVGAEGVHRTAACATDFVLSCDDRSQQGVVSCHMRGPKGDEGLAINACIDGRVTGTTAQFLETGVTVRASDFGEFVCGKEADGSDFCVVCDTFEIPEGGGSQCVKIVSNQELDEPTTCGAYNVSKDDTGALCPDATLDLQQAFSDPQVGFTIGADGSDAAEPAAGVGLEPGKDLLVCGSRSWQCIDDRSSEFALAAQQVQQQQSHALIDTPCCMRLASGAYYCSSKLTVSATCR